MSETSETTAQDVIDALRFALLAQNDAERVHGLVRMLLDLAPETGSDRGLKVILDLIAEGSLRVEAVSHE